MDSSQSSARITKNLVCDESDVIVEKHIRIYDYQKVLSESPRCTARTPLSVMQPATRLEDGASSNEYIRINSCILFSPYIVCDL